ncbi:MAG: radical SAM family heme chaperone HemW [Akkermansia sp.]|nr:radical SAM family heme chaperone HemW [Akkermansia sp.]
MHLYIHVPFCHRICPYCAFFKHTPGRSDIRGYAQSVGLEARMRLPQGTAPRTIYFGGGTPSMLSPTHLDILASGLRDWLDLSQVQEWSFESNPATFTAAKVQHWRRLGINRVSLGVQSFDPGLLKLLGREHSPEDVAESIRLLREAGIPQVNIDLMFSLPGQTLQQWERTLQCALDLQPDHISTYNLSYEEDTDFFQRYGAGAGNEETDVAMFNLADDLLTGAGFRHYEISNYARPGCESLHNLACWHGEDYCGLGPGAVGTMNGIRYCNDGNTNAYTAALLGGNLPPGTAEQLDPATRRTELLGLLLRTDEGLPAHMLRPQDTAFVAMLQSEQLATLAADGRLLLTRSGRLVADEIAVGLI